MLAIFVFIELNLYFSLISIKSKEPEFGDYKPFIFFSIVVSLSLSDLSAELPVIEFLEGKLIAI